MFDKAHFYSDAETMTAALNKVRKVERRRPPQGVPGGLVDKNGILCAGSHLIIDLFGAERLDDADYIAQTLSRCAKAAGATVLHLHLHRFEPHGGVSGVAVLAESHITIHSWPERAYAAVDAFMCGDADPRRCIDILRIAFRAERIEVEEFLRGRIE